MATDRELDRLAAMAAVLRPDWRATSTRTILARPDLARRPYADLAVALTVVATDPKSHTPARLAAHGPWWSAAYLASAEPGTEPAPPACVLHPDEPAGRCDPCLAAAAPPERVSALAAIARASRRRGTAGADVR